MVIKTTTEFTISIIYWILTWHCRRVSMRNYCQTTDHLISRWSNNFRGATPVQLILCQIMYNILPGLLNYRRVQLLFYIARKQSTFIFSELPHTAGSWLIIKTSSRVTQWLMKTSNLQKTLPQHSNPRSMIMYTADMWVWGCLLAASAGCLMPWLRWRNRSHLRNWLAKLIVNLGEGKCEHL